MFQRSGSGSKIWARQAGANRFEICCIPFFSYGFALGDYVDTEPFDDRKYVIKDVVERKGHTTFRIWFQDTEMWNSVIEELRGMGCFVEIRWDKSKLIAVDAPIPSEQKEIESYLAELESWGHLKFEKG